MASILREIKVSGIGEKKTENMKVQNSTNRQGQDRQSGTL